VEEGWEEEGEETVCSSDSGGEGKLRDGSWCRRRHSYEGERTGIFGGGGKGGGCSSEWVGRGAG
jgi:hypothetical protein